MTTLRRQDVTCGPLYRGVREQFTGNDPVQNRAFAQGFMAGEAEKVYLGACMAAMFRPTSTIGWQLVEQWAIGICRIYGLVYATIKYVDPSRNDEVVFEVWVCQDLEILKIVRSLTTNHDVNGKSWHMARGVLTGVSANDIDPRFHERQSTGDIDGDLT